MRFMLLIAISLSPVLLTACSNYCVLYPAPSGCVIDLATCSCTWPDSSLLEPQDASADADADVGASDTGMDAGETPY